MVKRRKNIDRKAIIVRDDFCCRRCGAGVDTEPLEVHHIVPLMLGGTNDPENLAALCRSCHKVAPDLSPGDADAFTEWCKGPADHLIVIAVRMGVSDPARVVLNYTAICKAIKAGAGEDPEVVADFMPFLGPDADRLRQEEAEQLAALLAA